MANRAGRRIVVVGAGASGLFCAALAAEAGHQVRVIEKNEKPGKKLFITGKGRCNFTNACPPEEFRANVVSNPRFLFSASEALTSADVIRLFEDWGMRTKVERGRRAFPASDHASDVIDALVRRLKHYQVRLDLQTEVIRLVTEPADPETGEAGETAAPKGAGENAAPKGTDEPAASAKDDGTGRRKPKKKKDRRTSRVRGVVVRDRRGRTETIEADTVVLATGGLSYPSTGSTGDGYSFARELGMKITPLSPSLVPFNCREEYVKELQGLALRNVRLCILDGRKELFNEFGELLFTHFGISGPLALSASAVAGSLVGKKELTTYIDLKPAVEREQLHARFAATFSENPKKALKNVLGAFYPSSLAAVIPGLAGLEEECRCCDISKAHREALVNVTKQLPLTLTSLRGYNEAVITRGGVATGEIDPKTMEAKCCEGLFVIGELLDVDAFTGGYNLQIAWCTAAACARSL